VNKVILLLKHLLSSAVHVLLYRRNSDSDSITFGKICLRDVWFMGVFTPHDYITLVSKGWNHVQKMDWFSSKKRRQWDSRPESSHICSAHFATDSFLNWRHYIW